MLPLKKNLKIQSSVLKHSKKENPRLPFFAFLFDHLHHVWHLVSLSMSKVPQCYYQTHKQVN